MAVWKYVPEERFVLDFVRGLRNFKGLKTITILEAFTAAFQRRYRPDIRFAVPENHS